MKKSLVFLCIGVSILVVGVLVFVFALSAPTVSGPAFMRVVWEVWMLAGFFSVGISAGIVVFKRFKKK